MPRLKSPTRIRKASQRSRPLLERKTASNKRKKKQLKPPLVKLSEAVRTIQHSRRSPLNRDNEICAKVLAAFKSAESAKLNTLRKHPLTTAKQKPKAAAKPAKKAVVKVCKQVFPKKPVKLTPFLKPQRERLHALRDSLLDTMTGVAKDALRTRPEDSEASAFGEHQADAGSDAYDKDFALSLLSQEQDALYEIEEALKRIDSGTYGICEMCGKPIPPSRLEALPFARLTVECQAEFEGTKKFQRYETPFTTLSRLQEMGTKAIAVSFHPFTEKCLQSAAWIEECFSKTPIEDFEWSCAIIPLCKGFEFELINRVLEPLKEMSSADLLYSDIEDKELSKVANFCAGKAKTLPELGVIAWFLRTAIHSKSRRKTSVLLRTFLSLVAAMADPNWVIEPQSLLQTLEQLTSKYRNPSAHTTTMSKEHYQDCRELISKPETGALWKLAAATYLKSKPIVDKVTKTEE